MVNGLYQCPSVGIRCHDAYRAVVNHVCQATKLHALLSEMWRLFTSPGQKQQMNCGKSMPQILSTELGLEDNGVSVAFCAQVPHDPGVRPAMGSQQLGVWSAKLQSWASGCINIFQVLEVRYLIRAEYR